MAIKSKLILIMTLTALVILVTFLMPQVSQPQSYHRFADFRTIWGVPNCLNVLTNLPFVIIGAIGLFDVATASAESGIRTSYFLLFVGVLLTGFGSAYYHWQPNNDTLVWDRFPLTIVFMAIFSATISEVWSPKIGKKMLFPVMIAGIGSVWWWHYTESKGSGDLRPYILIQYYPVLFIPLLLWLFYRPELKATIRALAWVVAWYLIAKVFERFDGEFYRVFGISGHSLKHLAAAVSTWYFIVLFRRRRNEYSTIRRD